MKLYMRKLYPFTTSWFDIWGPWVSGDKQGQAVVEKFPLHTVITDVKVSWYHAFVGELGGLGVIFFFVLSGFLITYLLFAERQSTGTVAIKAFYLRRIFRIWPLYYLIFIIGFFILPQWVASDLWYIPYQSEPFLDSGRFWWSALFYGIFFPNVAYALFGPFPNIGQSWSIGVEEQFYLIWPWILKKTKHPLRAMLIFLSAFLGLKLLSLIMYQINDGEVWGILKHLMAMSKLESMAIGGIGAWLLFYEKQRILGFIYSRPVQIIIWLGTPMLLYLTPRFLQDGLHLAYSIVFILIILNVSANPRSLLKFENPWLDTLGKISYGIYMYHMLIAVAVLHLVMILFPNASSVPWWLDAGIYLTTIGLTVVVSYLSYTFFESRFIRLKRKFTRVVSGDEARKA